MIGHSHYQGHLEAHVGACLHRSCIGYSGGHWGSGVCWPKRWGIGVGDAGQCSCRHTTCQVSWMVLSV
jgi:hypothetical protein